MADRDTLKQIVDKLRDSSNVLVTVNSNPSVDELSAALGITLLLNKLDKHATAVFSGDIPPAIEFLNPEKTFENTVDSLRDFIIALDKEKADHLRYKVVDDMVKIFITPYRTTINEQDLDFSQGDYNVEAVLAIGVQNEADLDHALESHGRILHDATVAAISLGAPTNLGGIEWNDAAASSYSELLYGLAQGLKSDKNLVDEQIATAFLTGIVAATERFSNDKTNSKSMTIAAELMAAGANQQLIATKLQEHETAPESPQSSDNGGDLKEGESRSLKNTQQTAEKKQDDAGALQISHQPEGDLDAVKDAIEAKQSAAALREANDELAAHTKDPVVADPMESAEKKLAEELRKGPAAGGIPSVADIQKDLATASEGVDAAAAPAAPNSAPSGADVKARTEQETDEPSIGGTLNATTEQAEEDKRRELQDDRNKVILNHGGQYTSNTPAFQAPLNATASEIAQEPEVKDIFDATAMAEPTVHVDAIQPPAPHESAPTLAEIDAKARAAHTDARAAIDAALDKSPTPSMAPPATTPGSEEATDLPPLPPLPPMPDFSTLPPLPGEETSNSTTISVPDTLGDVLPPSDPVSAPAQPSSSDPSQFRIPGQ